MADVYEQAAAYREELLALDAKAARQMANAYRSGYAVMQQRLKDVTTLIEEAKKAGEPVEPRWLFQQARWRQFYVALRDEITAYNKVARNITEQTQDRAVTLGTDHMRGLLREAFGKSPKTGFAYSFANPNDRALRAMVGFSQAGGPLSDLFTGIAPEAAKLATDVMRQGVLIGQNPLTMARSMQGPLGIPMWRSLTIARTESLRSYREAQRQTVLANSDVLEGWVWMSARDARTCEVCWAMTGKVFPITDGAAAAASGADAGPVRYPRNLAEWQASPEHASQVALSKAIRDQGLTKEEDAIVQKYGNSSKAINDALRAGTKPSTWTEAQIGQLDAAIRGTVTEDVPVWRGVGGSRGIPSVGYVHEEKGYTSFATRSDTVGVFTDPRNKVGRSATAGGTPYLQRIYLKRGQTVGGRVALDAILPRNTKFRVVAVHPGGDGYLPVVDMEIVR